MNLFNVGISYGPYGSRADLLGSIILDSVWRTQWAKFTSHVAVLEASMQSWGKMQSWKYFIKREASCGKSCLFTFACIMYIKPE